MGQFYSRETACVVRRDRGKLSDWNAISGFETSGGRDKVAIGIGALVVSRSGQRVFERRNADNFYVRYFAGESPRRGRLYAR